VKYTNLRAFEKHLEGAAPNHLSPIYIVLGKEAFQRKTAIDKLSSALRKGKNENDLMLQVLNANQLTARGLMQELSAFNLFSSKQAIIVEGAENLDKDSTAALEKYFNDPNPLIHLILSATSLHHGSNFYKKGEKVGIVLEILEEKSWEKERTIQEWIALTVAEEGKSIDSACCRQIVQALGTQQELLFSELQKLICYIGKRASITSHDIAAIISPVASDTVWQLGEAIFRRDSASAMSICKALLSDETPFFMLLRQLRSQFQTELQVCSILSLEGDPAAITRQFPYMKGNILERHIGYSQGYGMQGFIAGLLKIDDVELQAKNSGLDVGFLAELLIVKLTNVNFG
jgi:DNA polymerase III subunit delta